VRRPVAETLVRQAAADQIWPVRTEPLAQPPTVAAAFPAFCHFWDPCWEVAVVAV